MKSTPTKTVKKVVKKKPAQEMEYVLTISMNDEVIRVETNDLAETIKSLSPFNIKTRVLFIVEKNGKICERLVSAFQAKQIFRNKLYLFIFIKRLIFK